MSDGIVIGGQIHRCNRLRCPMAGLSGLQCYNMGHNGHGINLYGVLMIIMGNLHAWGHSDRGTRSPSTPGYSLISGISGTI